VLSIGREEKRERKKADELCLLLKLNAYIFPLINSKQE
jgi:hypothetical protein